MKKIGMLGGMSWESTSTYYKLLNEVIYKELCLGKVNKQSKNEYLKIIERLEKEDEVQGVILGCTEIAMLIKQDSVSIPIYDTTNLHVLSAVDFALSN
ncbi:MAG: hypothetical protein GY932_08430 [Arcobacter sp.]|nr:hypothetical protein [Arcobacter sp.]